MKTIARASIILNVILVAAASLWLGERLNRRQPASLSFQRGCAQIGTNDVVLMGDSIFELCEWSEIMPLPVRNRGVRGETTAQVLGRSEGIGRCHPRLVFLLVGINDLQNRVPLDISTSNYVAIIKALKPARVCCLGIMAPEPNHYRRFIAPGRDTLHLPTTGEVQGLNRRILEAARQTGCEFAPLPTLCDGTTDDGLHPNTLGYSNLVEVLMVHYF